MFVKIKIKEKPSLREIQKSILSFFNWEELMTLRVKNGIGTQVRVSSKAIAFKIAKRVAYTIIKRSTAKDSKVTVEYTAMAIEITICKEELLLKITEETNGIDDANFPKKYVEFLNKKYPLNNKLDPKGFGRGFREMILKQNHN